MSGDSTGTATSRISTFVILIIYAVLALAVVVLLLAINTFVSGKNLEVAAYLALIGVIAMGMSGYMLLQSRKRTMKLKIAAPPTMTQIECKKCGTKTVREFQRGDYVYKELGVCQKCPDDKMLITAIYREIKEKEKTFPF